MIQLDDASKFIAVTNVIPDGPADKAGIAQDDLITAIDGRLDQGPDDSASQREICAAKRARPLRSRFERSGAAIAPGHDHPRARSTSSACTARCCPNKIGYVALTVFGRDTGAELDAALARLQQQGARAVIMDLRDNGGGYLNAAVDVSSKFIPSGPIVSVESRASQHHDAGSQQHGDRPAPARRFSSTVHGVGIRDHVGRDSG